MVDESGGTASIHAVDDVFMRHEGWVQPVLGATVVDVDGPLAVTDLLSMPGDEVRMIGDEVGFSDGFGLDKLIKIHKVIAFVESTLFVADVGFLAGDDFATVGIDELTFLERLKAAKA